MAAPIRPVLNALRRKHGIPAPPVPEFDPHPGHTAQPEFDPKAWWQEQIQADPQYQSGLADLLAESGIDRGNVMAALRAALVKYGGAEALPGILAQLGGIGAGWEDLLDSTTLGGAQAADQGGTSLSAQLEKAHNQRMLAEADLRAARGMTNSGQTGYEIGETNQANVLARNEAIGNLLDFLRGEIGGYAGREGQRNKQKSGLLGEAGERLKDSGLEPPPPPKPPATSPALLAQLKRNAKRPPRRPLRAEDVGW